MIEHDKYVYATNIFASEEMKKFNIKDFDDWKEMERYNTISYAFKTKEKFSIEFATRI